MKLSFFRIFMGIDEQEFTFFGIRLHNYGIALVKRTVLIKEDTE